MRFVKIKTTEERFWEKVNKDGPIVREELGPCWLWTAGISNNGYGLFNKEGEGGKRHQIVAHRFSYMLTNETDIPKGMLACHKCDNKKCVRPDHIFIGTNTDNMQDAVRKGRIARGTGCGAYTHPEMKRRGENHGMAKLTEEQVLQIREIYFSAPMNSRGYRKRGTVRGISQKFSVSKNQVLGIVNGSKWKHLRDKNIQLSNEDLY